MNNLFLKRFPQFFEYLISTAVVAATTGLLNLIENFIAEADLIMVYLAVVVVLAYSFNRGPALYSAILSVAAFDFFFVSPNYTFAVDHNKYFISFAVMAVIGFLVSTFSEKLKQQLRETAAQEKRQRALYQLARSLAAASCKQDIFEVARQQITALCDANTSFCRLNKNAVEILSANKTTDNLNIISTVQMTYCIKERKEIIEGIDTRLEVQYLPVGHDDNTIVVVIFLKKAVSNEQRELLKTYITLVNLAITRTQLSEQAASIRIQAESEQLRNAILSAVSHDLRTPLGTIMGLVSTLLDKDVNIDQETKTEFLESIYKVTEQLSQKVTNLLQMSRNMRGKLKPKLELQNPEELIGGLLAKMEHRLKNHQLETVLDDTLLINCDLSLMEVVLSNLLDNAVKFSPEHSIICISGKRDTDYYRFSIEDQGCGLQEKNSQQLFDHFYREEHHDVAGTGLGLAIIKAIIEAHGGKVNALESTIKGAVFNVDIPSEAPFLGALNHE